MLSAWTSTIVVNKIDATHVVLEGVASNFVSSTINWEPVFIQIVEYLGIRN